MIEAIIFWAIVLSAAIIGAIVFGYLIVRYCLFIFIQYLVSNERTSGLIIGWLDAIATVFLIAYLFDWALRLMGVTW